MCNWPNVSPQRAHLASYWSAEGEMWACRRSKPKCGHVWWVAKPTREKLPYADAWDHAKRMIEGSSEKET